MSKTKIEWATDVWNPTTGCTKVSSGCKNCYAERMAKRFWRNGIDGNNYRPFSEVRCHPERLEQPLHWNKPRRIFVDSMSDLFHEKVPNTFVNQVFWIMMMAPIHIFIILTKRPKRMLEWVNKDFQTPLPNVWLGVSVENQEAADERIPLLLQTPAAVRVVSVEPMLENILLDDGEFSWLSCMSKSTDPDIEVECCMEFADCGSHYHGIDWVICGCESGPNRRPMELDWARSLRDQCQAADVPFFLKQAEIDGKVVKMPKLDGKIWDELPKIDNNHIENR